MVKASTKQTPYERTEMSASKSLYAYTNHPIHFEVNQYFLSTFLQLMRVLVEIYDHVDDYLIVPENFCPKNSCPLC